MSSSDIRRSDAGVALRALTKAVEAAFDRMDREAVAEHALKYPGSTGPQPNLSAAKTRNIIDCMREARMVLDALDGREPRHDHR